MALGLQILRELAELNDGQNELVLLNRVRFVGMRGGSREPRSAVDDYGHRNFGLFLLHIVPFGRFPIT